MTIFCWLPPDSSRDFLPRRGRADAEQLDERQRRLADALLAQKELEREVLGERGHDHVGFHVHAGGQAKSLAVLGEIADAVCDRVYRRSDRYVNAVNHDLARLRFVGAENRARHFGAARAHQAGEAENLALAHAKADVADQRRAVDIPHLEDDFARWRLSFSTLRIG